MLDLILAPKPWVHFLPSQSILWFEEGPHTYCSCHLSPAGCLFHVPTSLSPVVPTVISDSAAPLAPIVDQAGRGPAAPGDQDGVCRRPHFHHGLLLSRHTLQVITGQLPVPGPELMKSPVGGALSTQVHFRVEEPVLPARLTCSASCESGTSQSAQPRAPPETEASHQSPCQLWALQRQHGLVAPGTHCPPAETSMVTGHVPSSP